jgi:hypothetical protein
MPLGLPARTPPESEPTPQGSPRRPRRNSALKERDLTPASVAALKALGASYRAIHTLAHGDALWLVGRMRVDRAYDQPYEVIEGLVCVSGWLR